MEVRNLQDGMEVVGTRLGLVTDLTKGRELPSGCSLTLVLQESSKNFRLK